MCKYSILAIKSRPVVAKANWVYLLSRTFKREVLVVFHLFQ